MTISQFFLSGVLQPEMEEEDRLIPNNILKIALQMENSFVNIIDFHIQTRNSTSPQLWRTYFTKDTYLLYIFFEGKKSALEVGTIILSYNGASESLRREGKMRENQSCFYML